MIPRTIKVVQLSWWISLHWDPNSAIPPEVVDLRFSLEHSWLMRLTLSLTQIIQKKASRIYVGQRDPLKSWPLYNLLHGHQYIPARNHWKHGGVFWLQKLTKRKDRFSTLAAPVIQLRECNPHRRKLPQRPSKTNCLVDNGQLWPSIIACVETCLREFTPERFGERKQANTRSFGNNFSPTAIALGSSKGLRANSCFGVSWGKSLLGQMAFAQETVL